MTQARLEHVNITVEDPGKTADCLCMLFDWHIRWRGEAIHGGETIHVGADDNYIAVYSKGDNGEAPDSYSTVGGLNHIGVVVDDLEDAEKRVMKAGYMPHSHADYEPGRRFYFHDENGMEYEVVSYSAGQM